MAAVSAKAAEYVDSARLFHRVKFGSVVSCSIDGNFGTYRTQAHLRNRGLFSCTCPSEYAPCKHVETLRETHRRKPSSFVNVDTVLEGLKSKRKEELIRLMREMALRAPTALGALGLEGFDDTGEDEDGEDDW